MMPCNQQVHHFTKPVPHVRWFLRRDMPEVLAIERASFEFPWSEDDFCDALRQRSTNALVAEVCDRVVGYVVYGLEKRCVHVENLAVAPNYRRLGIGRAFVDRLKAKLTTQRRTHLRCMVRERNLSAQLFLRACGLRAVDVVRGWYEDTEEDAYVFAYRVGGPGDVLEDATA